MKMEAALELRQLRYFVRTVEMGSLGKAAKALGIVTSALSQQMQNLESDLSTRLLQRSTSGVQPTDAGLAFYKQAQLALRHADDAVRQAQGARLSGHVSVGIPSSTATLLSLPFIAAMRDRYPDIHLRLVEGLSGQLEAMLSSRQLDLAILFDATANQSWVGQSLVTERLFLIGREDMFALTERVESGGGVTLTSVLDIPLILPSQVHGLRTVVDAMFSRKRRTPKVILEIDGLASLANAVRAGVGATIQPGAASVHFNGQGIERIRIQDRLARRHSVLASLREDELSPCALAARIALLEVVRQVASDEHWPGGTLHNL